MGIADAQGRRPPGTASGWAPPTGSAEADHGPLAADEEAFEDALDETELLERERADRRTARASLAARLRRGPLLSRIGRLDRRGARLVRRQARSRRVTRQIRRFSRAGEHGALWLAVGVVGLAVDAPRRDRWGRGTAAVGAAYLLNTGLKQVARRPRPDHDGLPPLVGTPGSMSFPSSHAASSFAAATAFRHLLPRGPLYTGAAAMAISRVHLGVHYPSDIAVGASLGVAIGRLACPRRG